MTIVLADDHALLRQGVRRVIEGRGELRVVGEACSGVEAVEQVMRCQPDIVILDISMRGLNGLEAAGQIHKRCPSCRIVMLSMHSDEHYVRRAVKQGASGYVLKNAVEGELLAALDAVQRGQSFFSPALGDWMPKNPSAEPRSDPEDRYDRLTERERHIFQLLAEGNGNKDIANALGLSLHTVETHRARIMEKMGLRSTAELVLSAVRRGIVQ